MTHSQLLDALGLVDEPRCDRILSPMDGYFSPVSPRGGARIRRIDVHVCVYCDLVFEVSGDDGPGFVRSYPFARNCRRRRRPRP